MKNYIWLFFVLISLLPTLALADDAAKQNMILSPESEVEGETAEHSLRSLLKTIEVPRL